MNKLQGYRCVHCERALGAFTAKLQKCPHCLHKFEEGKKRVKQGWRL